MGLILKKDESEHEVIEGIEVIERSDVPDDLPENPVELVSGASAEDIASGDDEAQDAQAEGIDADGLDDEDGCEPASGDDGDGGDDGDDADGEPGDDESRDAGDDEPAHTGVLANVPRGVMVGGVAALIIVAVVAAVIGYVIGSGGFGGTGTGTAMVGEDQLDTVIASYTYNGASHDITVRSAIESEYSLESAQNSDGTYSVPSAETIISTVRNNILVSEAESRGIEVSDDEMDQFAESMLGSSDYATLATQYGVTEDQAKEIVRERALIQKLYSQVVPEASTATAPTEPTAPENGDTSTSSAEYAQYIIDLAGDEWDSENNTWASTDGSYYLALGDAFTGDTATYEQAVTAYYVAYQEYSNQMSGYTTTWTDFANGLFANANIRLYGVYA